MVHGLRHPDIDEKAGRLTAPGGSLPLSRRPNWKEQSRPTMAASHLHLRQRSCRKARLGRDAKEIASATNTTLITG